MPREFTRRLIDSLRVTKLTPKSASLLPWSESDFEDWAAKTTVEQAAANAELIDQRLVPWSKIIANPGRRYLDRAGFQLIFLHIPKTGGTTLEYLVAKNYLINGVLHINAPALDHNPFAVFKLRSDRMAHVLLGHYELSDVQYQWVNRSLLHMTMLRDPVRRVVSYFDYIQTSKNHPKHQLAKDLTLEEFVASDRMDEIRNAQSHRICGLLRRGAHHDYGNDDPRLLEMAQQNLRDRFSLFGLTERFNDFLLLCHRYLGWNDIYMKPRNVSKRKTPVDSISDSARAAIAERNAVDIKLYDYAKELFEQRWQEADIGPQAQSEYVRRNEEYLKLMKRIRG